jgi:F-type H+-transporting ATPase subunit delta
MEELARVYGRSLFEVAREHDKLDVVREQLGQVADALAEHRELQMFFFSPYFSTEEKKEALSRVIDGGENILMNFLKLLIENHRMPAIFRIRQHYERLWDEENRTLPVEITSAVELDEQTTESLGRAIGERAGRNVTLSARVDPDILGGIVVRVGNSILDASIRNRLEQLRRHVAQGAS